MDSGIVESRKITNRAIVDEIKSLKIKSVLDIGCGDGLLCPNFQQAGLSYFGLDGSADLIHTAVVRYGSLFQHLSYQDFIIQGLAGKSFEGALFNFSLMDEDVVPVLKAAVGCLQAQGTLLIQTLHPCFVLKPYVDSWNVEDFKSFPTKFEGTMPWFGRTLGSWVESFQNAGLRLEKLIEPVGEIGENGPVSVIFVLKTI